jgi:hypothetical protein
MKIHDILTRLFDGRRLDSLFSLLTPVQAMDRSGPVRLLLAGGSLAVLGTALATAATSAALMLLAVGVIYYLLTQVLGVKIDFDPQAFIPRARHYESAPSAPN